jgi:hypothetical protein
LPERKQRVAEVFSAIAEATSADKDHGREPAAIRARPRGPRFA